MSGSDPKEQWRMRIAQSVDTVKAVAQERLLRPSGKLSRDVYAVVKSMDEARLHICSDRPRDGRGDDCEWYPHDDWRSWIDIVGWMQYSLNWDCGRIPEKSFQLLETAFVGLDAVRHAALRINAKCGSQEGLFDPTEVEFTDYGGMFQFVAESHLEGIAVCLSNPREYSAGDPVSSMCVPDFSFGRRFAEDALALYRDGYWPIGWHWDGPVSGRFIVYDPSEELGE